MTRFVVLSCVFLGWAFYEVSGGADFAPSRNVAPVTETAKAPASDVAKAKSVETSTETRRRNPAPLASPEPAPKLPATLLQQSGAHATVVPAHLPVRSLLSEPEPIRKPTLMDDLVEAEIARMPVEGEVSVGGSIGITSSLAALTSADVRVIRGNRANMRAGPGKRYGVVSTLSRGQRVEVTEYSNRGWVHLRVIDSGQTGWMAEFLLVESN